MAKEKQLKSGTPGVPQKHLHSRLSFLHQAASYLATAGGQKTINDAIASSADAAPAQVADNTSRSINESTRLLMHLRGVSRKAQIRLSPRVKHSICKRCDALLIPGSTSEEATINSSKNGKKTVADILEIQCEKCGTVKRFPVGLEKPQKEGTTPAVR